MWLPHMKYKVERGNVINFKALSTKCYFELILHLTSLIGSFHPDSKFLEVLLHKVNTSPHLCIQ